MPDLPLTSWGQLALYVAGALSLILVSAAHWVRTMGTSFHTIGTSYDSVIAALQNQNTAQQTQLNEQGGKIVEMRGALDDSDKKCDQKIAALMSAKDRTETDIAALKKAVNGGLH